MMSKQAFRVRSAKIFAGLAMASALAFGAPQASAGVGDLLVAPTRIVFDGERGAEVFLNNIGSEVATYRVSLVLRRMTADGGLEEVDDENADVREAQALEMLRYAPRRITLPPNQPQAIRLGVRAPEGLEDGEYRVHMLFRAIPEARSVVEKTQVTEGVSISITPIYGVTIPIIIRKGNLQATAGISNVRLEQEASGPALAFDIARQGDRSTYGDIVILKQGVDEPIVRANGVAVYNEVNSRKVTLPVTQEVAQKLKGPITVEYYEPQKNGGGLITKTQLVLR